MLAYSFDRLILSGGNLGPGVGPSGGANATIAKARKFEQGNDFARAIETYLSLTTADTTDVDLLQQCWVQAASLAKSYQRHRMNDVVSAASSLLQGAERFQAAAELHVSPSCPHWDDS